MLLGVDTGGTFTDFVLLEDGVITIHKVLSTPAAPEMAIIQGIEELNITKAVASGKVVVVHGSTVATNAALEGKGVKTVYITNRGLKDVLTIGRQARPQLYELKPSIIKPPVAQDLCLETGGRLDAQGNLIEPLTDNDIDSLRQQINAIKPQAVAINLLFSFLDDTCEKQIEAAINSDIFTSRSSFVLPEYREYERGITTWLNAWLGPLVANYLARLEQKLAPSVVTVMQSSGGTIHAKHAAKRAVNLLLSGPAGGLSAARYLGKLSNSKRLLTFDMGGTSTDVALIDEDFELTNTGRIAHYPVAVPMVDMHTIGAGGGSIAYVDAGGSLQVGPLSAGAAPGPACYGQGGDKPTVTDANVVLGRIQPDTFLAGSLSLNVDAARTAINVIAQPLGLSVEDAALGILAIANEHMARALRVISVQRGHNPKDFQLCCFGGAGGLHVCDLAIALDIESILLPIHGGVLSAFGMLVAPRERRLSKTHRITLAHAANDSIEAVLSELAYAGRQQLAEEGIAEGNVKTRPSLDVRYIGQNATLNIRWQNIESIAKDFNQAHLKRYGHTLNTDIEIVNIKQHAYCPSNIVTLPKHKPQQKQASYQHASLYAIKGNTCIIDRSLLQAEQTIDGPAIINETVATTLITSDWQGKVDEYGNITLVRV